MSHIDETPCRVEADTNVYQLHQDKLDKAANIPADQKAILIEQELARLCADPKMVQEALSVDGFNGSDEDWNMRMLAVGEFISRVDPYKAGLILVSQARIYLREIAIQNVEESL